MKKLELNVVYYFEDEDFKALLESLGKTEEELIEMTKKNIIEQSTDEVKEVFVNLELTDEQEIQQMEGM